MMIHRQHILKKLTLLSKEFPVIALLGPRQVGKTTLVKEYTDKLRKEVVHLDMERAADRNQLADPELFFAAHRDTVVVIDEVQLMPVLFSVLRPEVDALRKNGRFILTGSASPDLVKGVSESLAGRIAFIDLPPINTTEADAAHIAMSKHWFRGGFPLALTAKSNDSFMRWSENFVRSYVERDLSMLFGAGISPQLARNFWNMLAISNGNIWNAEAMSRSLGVSGPTVNRYLDFLEGAFLLRKLPAWYINAKKRLVKAPKVYIRDSGILHFLTHVPDIRSLAKHPIVGASWEGYVIEEICKALPYSVKPYYYRTHHGAEVDLVLVKGIVPVACIEIKYGLAPKVKEGFYNCVADLGTSHNYIIYPGTEVYSNSANSETLPLDVFLTKKLKKITS